MQTRIGDEKDGQDASLVAAVAACVNEAYLRGERGMWKEGTNRTSPEEVARLLRQGKIMLMTSPAGGGFAEPVELVGCASLHIEGGEGEFGMLAVSQGFLGRGCGNSIFAACEAYCISKGCETMQLQILQPSEWKHDFKARLHDWYTRKGFVAGETADFSAAYPHLADSLACPCSFTVYRKRF